ncbi:MAG: hypothetical protein V2A72_08420 [Candidatus Omnitrophota bacterium]
MKRTLRNIILLTALLAIAYACIKAEGPIKRKIYASKNGRKIYKNIEEMESRVDKFFKGIGKGIKPGKAKAKKQSSAERVALYFKDGSTMIGQILETTDDKYIVDWKGMETVVYKDQIERVGSAYEALDKKGALSDEDISNWWPYQNDIAIRLKNGMVLDAEIIGVEKERIVIRHNIEGGHIEQDLARGDIEYLIFKPVDNDESKSAQARLERSFGKMQLYKEGNFTIVTDSYITWVNECKKTLRSVYTELYFKFFDLLKTRKPKMQIFVVIFDSYPDFVEYAVSDGVPGWAVAGYFSPEDKVLYMFNILGERFSGILLEAIAGQTGRKIDDIVDKVKAQVDERYHIFIEGQAKQINDKYWEVYNYYKDSFREATLSTLRHEFTHSIFHNWGLQSIELSKYEKDKEELIKRKKDYIDTDDSKKKTKLIDRLISMRGDDESLDVKAANSWLAEGIATYSETDPIGSQNDRWLFIYQEMARKNTVYPLEFLTVYKIGSFPGVYSSAMLDLYAQSWALVNFLMEKYPKEFIAYQERMSAQVAAGQEDVKWLSEAIGKDIRAIESEFTEYMKSFEELEDPLLKHIGRLQDIFKG